MKRASTRTNVVSAAVACALSLLAFSRCALLGKYDPVVPRYFTPIGDAAMPAAPPQTAQPGAGDLQLRLGRIEGLSHLRERMVVRTSPEELVFYEDRRWTERPEIYLRRALAQALFAERGATEVLSGNALTLDVELTAFEEIEKPHIARLQASFMLRDARVALLEETLTIEQPIRETSPVDQPLALVEALSQALHKGTEQIADHTMAKLSALKSQ